MCEAIEFNGLAFDLRKHRTPDDGETWIELAVLIDGQPFGQDFAVDIFEFAKSCQSVGAMELFTCGCGNAGCAGISEGVQVSHSASAIHWRCPDPMAGDWESDAEYPAGWRDFAFEPTSYADVVEECIGRIISLAFSPPFTSNIPVYGRKLEELLLLEARPFSGRLTGERQSIVARTVVIDAYVNRILIGGNDYRLRDIHLPEELMRLNREREALQVFPNDDEGLSEYLAYLEASRKFCRAFRNYVGQGTKVLLTYHPPKAYNADAWEITETI